MKTSKERLSTVISAFAYAGLLCGSVAFSGRASAQATPAATGEASQAVAQRPLFDPKQLPQYEGQVHQFTLTPRGDIDGLLLADGTEVTIPPHLSSQVAAILKPGHRVTIHGLKAYALPLIKAVSLTDRDSGTVVVDAGPPDRPTPGLDPKAVPGAPPPPGLAGPGPGERMAPPPVAAAGNLSQSQGRVKATLHGAEGEVNGVLLEDGTILRFPPAAGVSKAGLLQPGRNILARGALVQNAFGKVLDVRQIGTSQDSLEQIADAGPGRGPKNRLGDPRPI